MYCVFFFKQKTAYEMRISDWSSDVCSSDLFQVLERRQDRQAADELRDQPELQQILRLDLAQDFPGPAVVRRPHVGTEADRRAPGAVGDDLLQAREGAATDEQDVGGIDLQELLLRVLAAALRRHAGDRSLHDLQQGLLHPLARDVAGDRRVVGLAADLVDLVDIEDRKSTRLNSSH